METIAFIDGRTCPFRTYVRNLASSIDKEPTGSVKYNRLVTRWLDLRECVEQAKYISIQDFRDMMNELGRGEYTITLPFFHSTPSLSNTARLTIVKKLRFSNDEIKDLPIFEFRVNIEGDTEFGFRSIFFVTSRLWQDKHSEYECYLDAFTKKIYVDSETRSNGNTTTDFYAKKCCDLYHSYKEKMDDFDEYFLNEEFKMGSVFNVQIS